MQEQFIRTQMLLGADAVQRLQKARVALFGLGGVGGYTLEALVRSGIGALDLIDRDTVSLSNLNRQILATHSTVGMLKVEAARRRVLDINPSCVVNTYPVFYTPETATSWTHPPLKWRIFPRPPCVLWPGSCAGNWASGASSI